MDFFKTIEEEFNNKTNRMIDLMWSTSYKTEKEINMEIEITYKHDGCTGLVAFVIKTTKSSYTSPFIYESTDDAYHAACIDLKK